MYFEDPLRVWLRLEVVRDLAALLRQVPTGRRAALMKAAAAYRPPPAWSAVFPVGRVRLAFAACWQFHYYEPVPITALRAFLTDPISVHTQIQLGRLNVLEDIPAIERAICQLVEHLHDAVSGPQKPPDEPRAPPDSLPE
jgi:hypothetical protein